MIISFEGSVCAGKTSISTKLAQERGLYTIPEYMKLLNEDELKRYLISSPSDKLRLFLSVDDRRNEIPNSIADTIILDRSFLCLYAFEYAMTGMNENYENDFVIESLTSRPFLFPSSIVYFYTDEEIRRARCKQRGSSMPEFFLTSEFNRHSLDFFNVVAKHISTGFLDTSRLDVNQVFEAAINMLNVSAQKTNELALINDILYLFKS